MSTQAPQTDIYEWHLSEPDVWKRTCLGFEASASFNENIADGHTELSVVTSFRMHQPRSSRIAGSELELDQLVQRARQAWIQMRYLRPEVAVQMDTHIDPTVPQTFKYQVLRDEQSLRRWVNETFVVVRLGEPGVKSVDEICAYTYNRPLPTKGKQSMLYLVQPRLGDVTDQSAHIIWNVSHAVTDGSSIVDFFNILLQCMVDAVPSAPYDSIYIPTPFELNVLPRLPRSVVSAYRQQFKPKPEETKKAHEAAQANMRLISDKMDQSLALQPAASWPSRKHETICLLKTMEATEAKDLFKFAKQRGSGITYLASAATIMATAETYPERKALSKGALLGMVRNSRRWLSTTSLDGVTGTSTPLGSDAVFLWIPVDANGSLEPSLERLDDLVSIAGKIRYELGQHLTTPHCISAFPTVANGQISALTEQWSQIESANAASPPRRRSQLDNIIGAQAPGFSSVGEFKIKPRFLPASASARASGAWLEFLDITHRGRQVNASPWMSMATLDGRIKFQLGFDTKFHDVDKMTQLMELTFDWMRRCAAAGAANNSSDLTSIVARL
ncbi:probable Acyltransferase invovled in MEL production [Ustilago trichophora]|uniref:Probable Acyltransferase invovled in MEL production n=1 Tax=Ustilago trichophora TaxID=86804 RepID=A0A5C3EKI2_9BASI|nr:probable Acyltransferase invovled in MEL production [Ustilago trichophora]